MRHSRMQLLGMPAHDNDGTRPLRLGNKPLILLARLFLESRPVAREAMMAFLWPEAHEHNARGSLRQALHAIREAIGFDCFTTDRRSMGLRQPPATDLLDFLQAIRQNDLRSAALAYRGPLLDGVTVLDATDAEMWLDFERRRLGKLFETAAFTALENGALPNTHPDRLAIARRLRDHQPRLARAWQLLLGAIAAMGAEDALRLERASLTAHLEAGRMDDRDLAEALLRDDGAAFAPDR